MSLFLYYITMLLTKKKKKRNKFEASVNKHKPYSPQKYTVVKNPGKLTIIIVCC